MEGYRNLLRLSSQAFLEGFYYRPRIDKEVLAAHSRGLSCLSGCLAGEVNHRDSIGNAGTIGAGDVQWMTAGGGIMHEEMPKPREGVMAGFQLWVNLPARLKMMQPRYQDIAAAQIPEKASAEGKVR